MSKMDGRDENEEAGRNKRVRKQAPPPLATYGSFSKGKGSHAMEGDGLALADIPVLRQRIENERYLDANEKLFQLLCPKRDDVANKTESILQHKGFKSPALVDKLKSQVKGLIKDKALTAKIWYLLALPDQIPPNETVLTKFLLKPSMDLIDEKFVCTEDKEQKRQAHQTRSSGASKPEAVHSPRGANRSLRGNAGVKTRGRSSHATDPAADEIKTEPVEGIAAPSFFTEGPTVSTRSRASDKYHPLQVQTTAKDAETKKGRCKKPLVSGDKEQQGGRGQARKASAAVAASDQNATQESGELPESGDAAVDTKVLHDNEASTAITSRNTRNAARTGGKPDRSRASSLGVSQDAGVKKSGKRSIPKKEKSTELDEDVKQSHDHEMQQQDGPVVPEVVMAPACSQPAGPPGLVLPASRSAAPKDAAKDSEVPVVGAPDTAPVLPPSSTSPLANAVTGGALTAGLAQQHPVPCGPVTLPVSGSEEPAKASPEHAKSKGLYASTRPSQQLAAVLPPGVHPPAASHLAAARASTPVAHGTSRCTTNSSAPSRGRTERTTSDEEEDDLPPGIEPSSKPSNKRPRLAEKPGPPPAAPPIVGAVPESKHAEAIQAVTTASGQGLPVSGSNAAAAKPAPAIAGDAENEADGRPTDGGVKAEGAVNSSEGHPQGTTGTQQQQHQQQQNESDVGAAPMDTDDAFAAAAPEATAAPVQHAETHGAPEGKEESTQGAVEPANTPRVSQTGPFAIAAKLPPPPRQPPPLVPGTAKGAAPAPKSEPATAETTANPSQEGKGGATAATNAPPSGAATADAQRATSAPDTEAAEPDVDAIIANTAQPATIMGSSYCPKLAPLPKGYTVKKFTVDATKDAVEEELVRAILWKIPPPFDVRRRAIRYNTIVAGCLLGRALKHSCLESEVVGQKLLKVKKHHVYKLLTKMFGATDKDLVEYAEDIRVAFQVVMMQFPGSREAVTPTPAPVAPVEKKAIPRVSENLMLDDSEEDPVSSGDDDFQPDDADQDMQDEIMSPEALKY